MTLGGQGRIALVLAVMAGGLACGNGTRGGTGGTPVVTLTKTSSASGDAQTATVGTALLNVLRVVVAEDGVPQQGVEVLWAVESGGGSVTAADTTDVFGVAAATWTLGTIAGNQAVTATLAGATGSPVGFVAIGTAGPAAQIVKLSGENQTTVVTAAFGAAFRVKVTDQYANPVQDATVNWAGTAGLTPGPSATTDIKGEASTTATAGPTAGNSQLIATVAGTAAATTFHQTVIAVANRTITMDNIFFLSTTNGSQNPAVDTVAAGETVGWTVVAGTHGVQSTGATTFTDSGVLDGANPSYFLTFSTPGTYTYQCSQHGNRMTGRLVVQ